MGCIGSKNSIPDGSGSSTDINNDNNIQRKDGTINRSNSKLKKESSPAAQAARDSPRNNNKSASSRNASSGSGGSPLPSGHLHPHDPDPVAQSKSRAIEYSAHHSLHSQHDSRGDSDAPSRTGVSSGVGGGDDVASMLTIPLFESLDTRHLKQLRSIFTRRRFHEGEIIVAEGGHPQSCFHVVIQGRVEITAKGADGEPVLLLELAHGDFFGEGTLVQDSIQAVTARAVENNTVIYLIQSPDFNAALKRFPELGVSVDVVGRNPPLKVQLRKIPFFAEVPELKLQQLGALCEVRHFDAGKTICQQGQVADGFYFIIQGRVEVHVTGDASSPRLGANSDSQNRVYLDTLTSGDWFGEIALLEQTRRTASVTATHDCIVLFLSRERFHRFLRVAPEVLSSGVFDTDVRRRTANSLKAIPIFASLKKKQVGPLATFDEARLALLGQLFRFVTIDAGVTIFHEGDVGQAFYIVVKGTCTVTAKTPTGEDAFLADLTTNDWFGETSLLNGSRCNATVIAKTDCVLLKLLGENFHQFTTIAPEVDAIFRQRVSVRTAQRLAKIPFFAAVRENKPWSKLDLLGGLFTFEELLCDHVVFREGDIGDKFYIIVAGSIEVRVRRGDENVLLDTLGPDDWFGEISLMRQTKRTATVTCKSDCVFLSITKEKFHKFLTIAPELTDPFNALLMHRTANMLKTLPIFKHVHENKPWSKMEMLGTLFAYEMHSKDDCVYKAGDKADRFYLLMNGHVLLKQADGTERLLVAQSSFGDIELWMNTPRTDTVICKDTVVLLYVNREKFGQLQQIAPELTAYFNDNVKKQLAERAKSQPTSIRIVEEDKKEVDRDVEARSSTTTSTVDNVHSDLNSLNDEFLPLHLSVETAAASAETSVVSHHNSVSETPILKLHPFNSEDTDILDTSATHPQVNPFVPSSSLNAPSSTSSSLTHTTPSQSHPPDSPATTAASVSPLHSNTDNTHNNNLSSSSKQVDAEASDSSIQFTTHHGNINGGNSHENSEVHWNDGDSHLPHTRSGSISLKANELAISVNGVHLVTGDSTLNHTIAAVGSNDDPTSS